MHFTYTIQFILGGIDVFIKVLIGTTNDLLVSFDAYICCNMYFRKSSKKAIPCQQASNSLRVRVVNRHTWEAEEEGPSLCSQNLINGLLTPSEYCIEGGLGALQQDPNMSHVMTSLESKGYAIKKLGGTTLSWQKG